MISFLTSLLCPRARSGSQLSITSSLKSKATHHHPPPLSPTHSICLSSAGIPCASFGATQIPSHQVLTLRLHALQTALPQRKPLKGRKKDEENEGSWILQKPSSLRLSPPPSHSSNKQGCRAAEKRQGGEGSYSSFSGHDCMIYCCVYFSLTLLFTKSPSPLILLHLFPTLAVTGEGEAGKRNLGEQDTHFSNLGFDLYSQENVC